MTVTVTVGPDVVTVTGPTVTVSPGLFFRRTTGPFAKLVLAHYFGPYPRSLNNSGTRASSTYISSLANPSGQYAAYRGWFDDAPLWRAPIPGDWQYADAVFDIQTAQAYGIDGFVVDMLGLSGPNYDNYARLARAASDLNSGFYVIPMVDKNGATGLASPQQAATAIATFAGLKSSYYFPDGTFMVSSFKGEGNNTAADVQWWKDVQAALVALGIRPAFVLSFLAFGAAGSFTAITRGEGSWGDGDDPAIIRNSTNQTAQSHARGKLSFVHIGSQQIRRASYAFDEAGNTEATRESWAKALREGADMVQLITWSDFSEGSTLAPSELRGYAPLVLNAWYAEQFHTGTVPTILTDEVIVSHRPAPVNAPWTVNPTGRPITQRPLGGTVTPARDTVEVLSFLTAPSQITVTIGGVAQTYMAPAGMSAKLFPLAPGSITVTTDRGLSGSSPVPPVALPVKDVKAYVWFSLALGTTGQRAPHIQ
jgi:hypothetical protein